MRFKVVLEPDEEGGYAVYVPSLPGKVPSVSYIQVIKALQRDGWIVVRQRGSHIRLQKM